MRKYYWFTLCVAMIALSLTANAQIKDAVWVHGGNKTTIRDLVFSPNSNYLASTLGDGSIRIWDLANGNLVRLFTGGTAFAIEYTPTGDTITAGCEDGQVRMWRVSTGQLIRAFQAHTGKINSISYSPEGRFLATGGVDTDVKIWDTWSGTIVKTMSGHLGPINEVDFSSDGIMIASASDDFRVRLWNRNSGDTIRSYYWKDFVVRGVALHTGTQRMAVPAGNCPGNGPGCGVIIYRTDDTTRHRTYTGPHYLDAMAVAYSADGNLAASGGRDGRVCYYQPNSTSAAPRVAHWHSGWVNTVAFSPNSVYLASGADDKVIKVRNMSTGDTLTLVDGGADVSAVALTRTAPYTAIGGNNEGSVMAWSQTNFKRFYKRGHTAPVQGIAAVPNQADEVLSAGIDGRVRRWKISTAAQVDSFPKAPATAAPFTSIAYAGLTLASGHSAPETGVKIWDPLVGNETKTLAGNTSGVRGVAATADGNSVASAGDDNSVRVWDRITGAVKLTLTDHTAAVNAVAFSPDGKYLASGSDDRTVRVYQYPSGTPAGIYTSHSGIITGLAFTSDSKYLVSSSEDKTLRVTQVSTGDNVYIYNSYPYPQLSVDVMGNYVLSGAADGMMILWDLKTSGGAQLAAPQLRAPANDVTGIAPQVMFQWDAVPGGETYKLQVSTSASFATGNIVDESGLTGTSKEVTTLATNTKYYWRVKAEGGGGESPWSQVWNFTTSNGGPSTPVQVSPADLATDQPLSLTLSWNASPGATYYRIEISNFSDATKPDGTFISRWKSENITAKTVDPNRPDTFYVVTGMDQNTTYYWHVLAQNTVAPSTWSPVWEFTTTGPADVTEGLAGVMRQGYLLEEARPNPVAAGTTIRFVTPKRGNVRLSVVDELGSVVAVLADRTVETGEHTATFDATALGAGVYFTRLEADGVVLTVKVVVVK